MQRKLEKAAAALRDREAGWVTRRDGAEFLGHCAAYALGVLNEFREESDVDVRRTIDEALGQASAALQGVAPAGAATGRPLEALVRHCEKPGQRDVAREDDGYVIDVTLRNGRTQRVYVSPVTRKDGLELVSVHTYCGPPGDDALRWALRTNRKLVQAALALWDNDGEEQLVLINSFFASKVTPAEMKAAVKEIAYYGDWIEQKLTGLDDF